MKQQKYLIVLTGPTAVGKTELSLHLAKEFNSVIVSADSRQIFKEMNIGTAKPSAEEMTSVQHYFVSSHSVTEDYNVGKYEVEVISLLKKLFLQKDIILLVGGSGLYIKAVCEGLDEFPESDPGIRTKLNDELNEKGFSSLQEKLKFVDPEYYEIIDKNNPHRVIRALEVFYKTGIPISAFRTNRKKERFFEVIKIGIRRDREDLYRRIDKRMDDMLEEGLLEEARSLYLFKDKTALQTVGYSEIFEFIDGRQTWEETVRLLKRNSRRYAKRQMTWFNKDNEIEWFEPHEAERIKNYIQLRTGYK
jgi:tRNA dimethylallyltransferase